MEDAKRTFKPSKWTDFPQDFLPIFYREGLEIKFMSIEIIDLIEKTDTGCKHGTNSVQ